MKLTSKEIAKIISGQLEGSEDILITGANGLEDAGQSDVSFASNPKYLSKIDESKAGLIIVPDSLSKLNRPAVKVKNPQLAFAKILEIFAPEINPSEKSGIHQTAVVSKSAKIGKNVTIGACAVIEEDASIGDDARILANSYIGRKSSIGKASFIYPNVTVRERVTVGDRCIIHSGTVVGSDGFGFAADGKKHYKIPQLGSVEIGDDVEIGANTTIDRATTGKTKIGSGTKIDNLVQIAHNVHIGKNCILVAQVGIAGSTKIGDNVVFAGQSGSVGHVTIGNNVIIAGRGVATRDIKDGEIISGFPGRSHKEELKIEAIIRKLPEIYEKLKKFLGEKN
ncbi:MAG: UDP-3-O-(3-hydroxymyristoyl)glucosamine N-acyltransferase [Elusimicrobiota bacterium]